MKINELNCLLGKINCTLNSIKSNGTPHDRLVIESLLEEIEVFQDSLPSNQDVEKSLDTILFLLDEELGNLIDEVVDHIEYEKASTPEVEHLDVISKKDDSSSVAPAHKLPEFNHKSLPLSSSTDETEQAKYDSKKQLVESRLASEAEKNSVTTDNKDMIFTVQGVFGASCASSSSETKIELYISHKYLWNSVNKRLTDMAYRKIGYNSINLGLFADFLKRFYSPNKSIFSMIELYVDMGEYLKIDEDIVFKGDAIVVSIFSSTTSLIKNTHAFDKRYLHKSSVSEIIKEVSLLESEDNKLNAIFNF